MGPVTCPGLSFTRIEIAQIRRGLAFLGWHQHIIPTQEIILTADQNVVIVLGAVVLRSDRMGIAARRVLPAEAQIYVLNGLESGANPADYAEHALAPVIGGEEELQRWSTFAARRNWRRPCALHRRPGSSRLIDEGLLPRRSQALRLPGTNRVGLFRKPINLVVG